MDKANKDTFLMSCLTVSMGFEAIHLMWLPHGIFLMFPTPKQMGDVFILWMLGG